MTAERSGVLLIDKPEGPTSHDVVAAARRALGTRRIGHAGTLDPFATGLLLLCVGSATRLAEYATRLDKRYDAVMRLGESTATDDLTGEVTAVSPAWQDVERQDIEAALASMQGELLQQPPAFSAKKVAGERSHRIARRGGVVELAPVRVLVHEILLRHFEPPDAAFSVRCSSGTYIRSIARDAGELLGCHAHLRELRRTAIGSFAVERAIPLAALDAGSVADALLPPASAVSHLPAIELDADSAARLALGQPVAAPAGAADAGEAAALLDGRLVAIVRIRDAQVHPRKVIADA